MDTRHPETLRILCFGDSLTAGYTRYGLEHYPYSDFLKKTLRKFFPSTKITIDNSGLSGDRVKAGRFLRRMEGKCAKAAANPYNWVIVLGGTNDLGWGEAPEAIYEALSMLFLLLVIHRLPPRIVVFKAVVKMKPVLVLHDPALPSLLTGQIEKTWNTALDTGANLLACTVIECASSSESLIRRRNALNALIAEHVQDR